MEEKLRQKELVDKDKLIDKIEELKKYKQKYVEMLDKSKEKDTNMPLLETEEEAAENIADIYERKDDTRKKEESDFNEYGIDINGLNRDGYNINGINEYGVDRDSYDINGVGRNGIDRNSLNINGIEGTRKRYPKKEMLIIKKMIIVFCTIGMDLIREDLIKMVMIYMDLI